MILDKFGKMGKHCCHVLYVALYNTRDSKELAKAFKKQVKEASQGFILCHKQLFFYSCALMYMDGRWEYDHKYFQRMIKRDKRLNPEIVGAIITNCMTKFRANPPVKRGLCRVYKREQEKTPLVTMIPIHVMMI